VLFRHGPSLSGNLLAREIILGGSAGEIPRLPDSMQRTHACTRTPCTRTYRGKCVKRRHTPQRSPTNESTAIGIQKWSPSRESVALSLSVSLCSLCRRWRHRTKSNSRPSIRNLRGEWTVLLKFYSTTIHIAVTELIFSGGEYRRTKKSSRYSRGRYISKVRLDSRDISIGGTIESATR
jgi:hypothetical protein